MEVDQADSPGDSSPDPEISRFIENMGLRFESRWFYSALIPPLTAETRPVFRNQAPSYLDYQAGAANLASLPGAAQRPAKQDQEMVWSRDRKQPLIWKASGESASSPAKPTLQNSRVRITV